MNSSGVLYKYRDENGVTKYVEYPSTAKKLYEYTKGIYDKKYNRYVKNWSSEIMDASTKGEFTVTLGVCDWDCDEYEPRQFVEDAIEHIKKMFKGISIEWEGHHCFWYTASWNLDDIESESEAEAEPKAAAAAAAASKADVSNLAEPDILTEPEVLRLLSMNYSSYIKA